MSATHSTIVLAMGFLIFQAASADDTLATDRLFQSDDILQVRIVAPMTTLLTERPYEEDLAATLSLTDSTDATTTAVELDIGIRTRGRFRRQRENCRFPPMRLNFQKSTVDGTVFQNQDKLKLVTHCKPGRRYTQSILREYLAYRILNVLSDASYQVRLLRITYVDSENKRKDEQRLGFLIEHKKRLAARLNKAVVDISRSYIPDHDAAHTNLTSVFHYLIGNTDFSPIRAAPGETCCHNHVLFAASGGKIFSVPYDFDQSGIVDAAYALPSLNFDIRDVRERLYRGRCVNNDRLPATLELLRERQQAIADVVNQLQPLSTRTRASVLRYIDRFYRTIESERQVDKEFLKKCI